MKIFFKPLLTLNKRIKHNFFIAKFAYNNTKNTNINHLSFELNCRYYFCIFYKEDFDPY